MILVKRVPTFLVFFVLLFQPHLVKAQTVYVTQTGKKYHKEDCYYLRSSKNAIELSSAKSSGYQACKICFPTTTIATKTNYLNAPFDWKLQLSSLLFLIFTARLATNYYQNRKAIPEKLNLSTLEKTVIKSIINSDDSIDTIEINRMLAIDKKSMDAQRKDRSVFLKTLNEKLENSYGLQDAIQRKSSEQDARLMIYMINPNELEKLKKVLED